MSSSRRPFSSATALLAALILFVPALAQAAWDQAKATGVAKELAESAQKLYDEMYEAAPDSLGMPAAMGGGDLHHEFLDTLRLLRSESRHLADELGKGKGAKETRPAYKRIGELNRDLLEYSRQLMLVKPVTGDFSAFEALVKQLDPYYAG